MPIQAIHVGCGKFSLQRLKILIDGNKFNPVACVDINLEKAVAAAVAAGSINQSGS
jgi:hypothetical protein